ncbi:MAG: hypothetical protein ABI315_06290 [Bacteroidia bacterium]
MTVFTAICIFSLFVVLMILSSFILSNSIDKLKKRFNISGGIVGMLAAVCSDAPEISSAIAALYINQGDIGIGIVVGSNIFNLAALLGVSALFAGQLHINRPATVFNGTVAILVILMMILLIFKFISPVISVILLMVVFIPYVFISDLKVDKMKGWNVPLKIRTFVTEAINVIDNSKTPMPKSWAWAWIGVLTLVVIVFSSIEIVRSAIFLSDAWNINKTILGVIILASLTGIPNVITAIKMALEKNDIAVMSEALNSNNLNIFFGVCIPSLIFGISALSKQTVFSVGWLLSITIINLLLLYFMKGFNRTSGLFSIALYLVFLFIMIRWS